MSFIPYTPPNEGSGLLSVDRDLCWRINPRGLVSPAVIGAVCWARNHFRMSDAQHQAVLDGLGLEYHQVPMGGITLRPKAAHRVALFRPAHSPPLVSNVANFPTFTLTAPLMPMRCYDAVEVTLGVEGSFCVGHNEDQDAALDALPHFWSVCIHLAIGHPETIADFPNRAQAEAFADVMRDVIGTARRDAGLDCSRLDGD